MRKKDWLLGFIFILIGFNGDGQDSRAQYPSFLQKSYFEINIGYIQYPFSSRQLEPGFQTAEINIPHVGVRLMLLGYRITPNLSAQISYMRPVLWVEYKDVNGDGRKHSVFMNVGGLTLKPRLPVSKKLSIFGEAGFALVTRSGFHSGNEMPVTDATMASILVGGGLKLHLNRKFDLQVSGIWSPANSKKKQPATSFISGGFTYNMSPLSDEKVKRNSSSGYIFPKQVLQIGLTTNALEYGVNSFFAEGVVPIFWGGDVQVRRAISVHYQRNVFHTRKVFSLDIGASAGIWETRKRRQKFLSLSAFPVLRFTAIRCKSADYYFTYSVAGPTYLSTITLDSLNTGKHFTFQDYMGIGSFIGKSRNLNAEIRIAHFSNGNIFPDNPGIMIPLSLHLGYAF